MTREARIRKLVRKHQRTLRLWDWEIGVDFPTEGMTNAADCEASPEYRQALLRFNLSKIPTEDDEAFVLHEAVHCWVEGLAHCALTLAGTDTKLQEWVRIEEENLTRAIQQIVVALTSASRPRA